MIPGVGKAESIHHHPMLMALNYDTTVSFHSFVPLVQMHNMGLDLPDFILFALSLCKEVLSMTFASLKGSYIFSAFL